MRINKNDKQEVYVADNVQAVFVCFKMKTTMEFYLSMSVSCSYGKQPMLIEILFF